MRSLLRAGTLRRRGGRGRVQRWDRVVVQAAKNWVADNAFKHAAAVSFYTLFSLAPITIIAVAVAGMAFGEEAARGQLSTQMDQLVGREGAKVVETAVVASRPGERTWFSAAVGIGVLLVGATTVFVQLQESLNQIWGVVAKPSRNSLIVLLGRRLVSLAMVLTVGFLLLVSLVLTTVLTTMINVANETVTLPLIILRGADIVLSLVVITILFAMVFKVLPDVHLRWSDVWRGAFVTALLFSVGRLLISYYLGHSTIASTYGAAGSLVALLMWVYYSCLILFFGAEFTRASREAAGLSVQPKSKAVRVRREIMEEGEPAE